MKAERIDVLRSPEWVRWNRCREDSTPHPIFSAKDFLWAELARLLEIPTPIQRARTLMLAKVCVTSLKIRADDFRRAKLCHHVKVRGYSWHACTQIPLQTPCRKKEARMYLRQRARKNVNVSGHPSEDPKGSVLLNERATPHNPALSSDSSARRANPEAAGGAL